MTFTIGQLKAAEEIFVVLSKEKLPSLVAFRLAKFLRVAGEELNKFEQKRNNLVVKYGEENKEKSISKVKEENLEKFKEELEPLLSESIDFVFKKLTLQELQTLTLTPTQAAQLEPFVDLG